MKRDLRVFAAAGSLAFAFFAADVAFAQKSGGILKIPARDSPASLSIHEESPMSTLGPMMGVFNNLVIFDQHVRQNSLASIVPDLASNWSWNEDGNALIFKLREGVKSQTASRSPAATCSAPGI